MKITTIPDNTIRIARLEGTFLFFIQIIGWAQTILRKMANSIGLINDWAYKTPAMIITKEASNENTG